MKFDERVGNAFPRAFVKDLLRPIDHFAHDEHRANHRRRKAGQVCGADTGHLATDDHRIGHHDQFGTCSWRCRTVCPSSADRCLDAGFDLVDAAVRNAYDELPPLILLSALADFISIDFSVSEVLCRT